MSLSRPGRRATVKKERAALNRLARYLHTLGAIDATEILMVETAGLNDTATGRDALDAATYARVRALARARLVRSARTRTARPTAARDHALILVLGDMGLRSHEARSLLVSSIAAKRSDGLRPWLTVIGKGDKVRCCRSRPTSTRRCWPGNANAHPSPPTRRCCSRASDTPAATARSPTPAASSPAKRCQRSSSRSCSPPASPRVVRVYESSATPHVAISTGSVFVCEVASTGDAAHPKRPGARLRGDRAYRAAQIRSRAQLLELGADVWMSAVRRP